jgi:BlaI family penicillinase repressor
MKQPKLSGLERRVMEALWVCGKASIREVLEVFPEPRPAYTTIQTIVNRLELKQAVHRLRKIGNAHIFEPILDPMLFEAPVSTRERLLDKVLLVFGSPQLMLAHLIATGKLTFDEIRELEKQQPAGL